MILAIKYYGGRDEYVTAYSSRMHLALVQLSSQKS